MHTLIITKKNISQVLTPELANKTVAKAFQAYGLGQVDMPAKSYLYFQQGDLRSMPAYIHGQGFDIAGIKSVNVHPHNVKYDLPTVMAVIILTDPKNGFPLAVLDGTYLTSMRTGAAGALAAKLLSKKTARTASFVGCGSQARTQLTCLLKVRHITSIKIWQHSFSSTSAQRFATWAKKTHHLAVSTSLDINEITTDTDILVTTTPSRNPLVKLVSPGTHINAIGADATGKQEIHASILQKAKLVIDDWAQASHSGEINVPVHKKQITRKNIYAELGQIAAGRKRGRTSSDSITLFDSTGLAIQDISCAYRVYQALKDKPRIKKVQLF